MAVVLVTVTAASGQSNFGSIRGVVKDSDGLVLPGVTVTVTDEGTAQQVVAVTDEAGAYVVPALRPVYYSVKGELPGFRAAATTGVKVDTARDARVDLVLAPGGVQESVEVVAAAPTLRTESGAVTLTVDQRTIQNLPLNGRNTLELALTLPGTTGSAGSELSELGTNLPLPGRELIVNGGRPGSTQFFADGANTTSVGLARTSVSFSPDAIQEFSVQQSNYSAQYAQAGGGIINQTTRSGTNEWRGSGYWFYREKALTATPFNAQRLPQLGNDARPPLERHQAGVTLGGPVRRNRTFFFASYEPTREERSNPSGASFARVPTDEEIAGDFRNSVVYLQNGTTVPYPQMYAQFDRLPDGTLTYRPNPAFNAALPESATNPRFQYDNFPMFDGNGRLLSLNGVSWVNPAAQRILRELMPRPNIDRITSGPNADANYLYFRRTENRDDRYSLRVDHRLGNAQNVYGRFTYTPSDGDRYMIDPIRQGLVSDTTRASQSLLAWNATLGSKIVNELRLSYVYGNFSRNFPSPLLEKDYTTPLLDLGGPGLGTPNYLGYGLADFRDLQRPNGGNGAQFPSMGLNGPQNVGKEKNHIYSLIDDLTLVRGRHTFKAGVAAYLRMFNVAANGYGYQAGGRWNFSPNQTRNAYCSANPLGGTIPGCAQNNATGDAYGSFLLGVPNTLFAYENIAQPYYYRWRDVGAYLQDDWKVRENLTLNLGVRYQYQSPRWEKFDRQGALDLATLETNPYSSSRAGIPANLPSPVFEFAGVDGRSRYLVEPQYLDFEPRLGFSWLPAQRWVVSGGYGLAHVPLYGNNKAPFPNLGSRADDFRRFNVLYGTSPRFDPSNVFFNGAARPEANIPLQFGYNNVLYRPDPGLFDIPAGGVIRPGDVNAAGRQDARYAQTGYARNTDFTTPYVQSYSVQVQRDLGGHTTVTAGYQGSRGTNLSIGTINVNQIDVFNANALTAQPYPGFNGPGDGRIAMLDVTRGTSQYHALITSVDRRFSRGLAFKFNYTFSRSEDDTSGGIDYDIANLSGQDQGAILIQRIQNPNDLASEWAVSSFDTPHVFNLSGIWELPFGSGRRFLDREGVLDWIVGGWQVSALGRLYSGYPVTVALGNANQVRDGGIGAAIRPNLVPGVPVVNPAWTPQNAATTPYVNPRAFVIPDPGTYGSAPRNFSDARLPWVKVLDMSLTKTVPFGGGRSLQFRADVFNVFNMKALTTNFNTSLFGSLAQNLPGQPNRYANLTPEVWDAILANDPTGLPGAPTAPAGESLSPRGVYTDLVGRLNGGFYRLNQNSILSRTIQLAVRVQF
ncbi:hypothetical protein TBR22_A41570 [Luteitalea sp. TBR-22]|nr:hypothetical protein TBR22_A41570 [Luteitalea sp. TBR-22]